MKWENSSKILKERFEDGEARIDRGRAEKMFLLPYVNEGYVALASYTRKCI